MTTISSQITPQTAEGPDDGGFRLKGRHVLFALIAFFGLIIAANSMFIYLAVTSYSGDVASNAYDRGLRYNDTLEARAAQKALNWRAGLGYDWQTDGQLDVRLDYLDAEGHPLRELELKATLSRPADAAFDREVVFRPQGEGLYSASVEGVEPGVWELNVEARHPSLKDAEKFEVRKRLWLKPQ